MVATRPRRPRRDLALVMLRAAGECWLCGGDTDRAICNRMNHSTIEICESCIGSCGIHLVEDTEFVIEER